MAVNLSEIAQRACVSVSTVSRVLNGYPYVSEATRETVARIASELGIPVAAIHKPERFRAVWLGGMGGAEDEDVSSSGTVVGTEFARLVLNGAEAVLKPHGISTSLTNTLSRYEALQKVRDNHTDSELIGVILIGGAVNRRSLEEFRQTGIPLVIAGGYGPEFGVSAVMADYIDGIEQAVAHLVTKGRRRIGMLNGPSRTTSEMKYKGYRLALALHELEYSPNFVMSAPTFRPETSLEFTRRLLTQAPELDAIIFADDYLAMGGLQAIKLLGKSVPGDVAVIGFHDSEIAKFTDPPLTTVQIDMYRMGMIAARRLLLMMEEDEHDPVLVTLPTTLAVRSST
jgi:LacI family transcriptional regulator